MKKQKKHLSENQTRCLMRCPCIHEDSPTMSTEEPIFYTVFTYTLKKVFLYERLKTNNNFTTLTFLTDQFDMGIMYLHDMLHNRKSKTCSSCLS